MAKGARSKVKKRFRSLKREQFNIVQGDQDLTELNRKLNLQTSGQEYRTAEPLNGFKYPQLGIIPQIKPQNIIDFRSSHVAISGKQFIGSQRSKRFAGDQVLVSYEEALNPKDESMEQIFEPEQIESNENEDESEEQMEIEKPKKIIKKDKFKKIQNKKSQKTLKF